MIPGLVENHVYSRLTSLHKVIIVLGARQVGKTTLLQTIHARLVQEDKSVCYLNCDLEEERSAINTTSAAGVYHEMPHPLKRRMVLMSIWSISKII